MLANLGTIFLLGLISVGGVNDQSDVYSYHAFVNNDSVMKSAYLYIESDDDTYDFYIDLAFSCDFYFRQGDDDYIINNFKFDTSLDTYIHNYTLLYANYTSSITMSSALHIYDLADTIYTFNWDFIHEDDTCHFTWYNDSALIGQSVFRCIPSAEEFVRDFHISVNVDCSAFYTQLLDFGNYVKGYDRGYSDGYGDGYQTGYTEGASGGYQTGYTDGYAEAINQDSTASVIFTGILEVGLLPVNVFLGIFNYEVFGINIGGFVASLLTIAIVVIIIRVILAKSGGGKN